MNSYGTIALIAASDYKKGYTPRRAWEKAAFEIFGESTSQKKVCPKSTFLALCENGFIKSIPTGLYTKAKENKEYALKAIHILIENNKQPSSLSPIELWDKVQDIDKRHNSQMDVVLALWNNNLIK